MSLETVFVKIEVEEVHVKEEECGHEESGAHVKEEAVSADVEYLYAGHQVKDELVLGHEELHRPRVPFTLPAAAGSGSDVPGRGCAVRLERPAAGTPRAGPPPPGTDTASASETYMCDECGKLFRYKAVLRKHISRHFKNPSTYFNKKLTRNGVETSNLQTKTIHTAKKVFICDHCGYRPREKWRLRSHVLIHTREKTFKCSQCDFKSLRKSNLVRHQRIHTVGYVAEIFKCKHCEYESTQKGTLQRHELIHTGEQPFTCTSCGFKCNQKASLRRHIMRHTGEKPFACSLCEYKCSRQTSLRSHEKRHSRMKPIKCNNCDYKCRNKSALKIHERKHTGV